MSVDRFKYLKKKCICIYVELDRLDDTHIDIKNSFLYIDVLPNTMFNNNNY